MESIDILTMDYQQYLTATEIAAIEHEASIMETREAAGIEALKVVQEHRGWVSDESLFAISIAVMISTLVPKCCNAFSKSSNSSYIRVYH